MPAMDNDLALSQDANRQHTFSEGDNIRPFHMLLRRRMEQLSFSPHDVAVSLGSTLEYVSDLRSGVKTPTEQRMAELALLLGVPQEGLRMAIKEQVSLAETKTETETKLC
jgi:transcriptional regulator with XRE-family HTH domain